MRRVLAVVTAFGIVAATIGPAIAQPPPPYPPVPPPRYEAVPPPPGARYVWAPGHWHWNGRSYAWIPGRYVVREAHWHHYVPGRWVWEPRFNHWAWRQAHWE